MELLQERVPQLETEVESLKLSLEGITSEKNNTIEKLKSDLKSKINEITNLQVDLSAKEKLYEDLLIQRSELQSDVDEMKMRLIQLENIEADFIKKEDEVKVLMEKIENLEDQLDFKKEEIEARDHEKEIIALEHNKLKEGIKSIEGLSQQIESLKSNSLQKDDLIVKLEKEISAYAQKEKTFDEKLQGLEDKIPNEEYNHIIEELQETRQELSNKMISYEKCRLELIDQEKEIHNLQSQLVGKDRTIKEITEDSTSLHGALSSIQNKMQESGNFVDLSKKLKDEQTKNETLSNEIKKLKKNAERIENSSSPKPMSFDEITEQVEKELNYSAQLDSNILKAIESDDLNSDEDNTHRHNVQELLRQSGDIDEEFKELRSNLESEMRRRKELSRMNSEILSELQEFKQKYDSARINCTKIQILLDQEKKNSSSIQQQDSNIIEAMRIRLEAAIDNESELTRQIDDERSKSERLSTQVQKSSSFHSMPLLKSPAESPRKFKEFESDVVARLQSDIKFLTAQNERERERVQDLQRVLERERHRFDKESTDRKEYGERIKNEINRVIKEKEDLQAEFDHVQERFQLANREIEGLESRLSSYQGFDSSRKTRGISDIDSSEKERSRLHETVYLLRGDLERGAQREAKLAESLARECSGDGQVPEFFLHKLKETNDLLVENSKENRDMAKTLAFLTEERRALQCKVAQLESSHGIIPRDDLEERVSFFFLLNTNLNQFNLI